MASTPAVRRGMSEHRRYRAVSDETEDGSESTEGTDGPEGTPGQESDSQESSEESGDETTEEQVDATGADTGANTEGDTEEEVEDAATVLDPETIGETVVEQTYRSRSCVAQQTQMVSGSSWLN